MPCDVMMSIVVTLGSKTSVQYPLRYLRYSTEPNQLLVLEWLRVGGVRLPTNKQHHLYGLATTEMCRLKCETLISPSSEA